MILPFALCGIRPNPQAKHQEKRAAEPAAPNDYARAHIRAVLRRRRRWAEAMLVDATFMTAHIRPALETVNSLMVCRSRSAAHGLPP
jgi:hypothetical protein